MNKTIKFKKYKWHYLRTLRTITTISYVSYLIFGDFSTERNTIMALCLGIVALGILLLGGNE